MIQFEIVNVPPEEQLRNDAMSIVHGYRHARLGRLQVAMLKQMQVPHPERWDPWGGFPWGRTYRDRRTLTTLKKRKLVSSDPPREGTMEWWAGQDFWNLTELGWHVGKILKEMDDDQG